METAYVILASFGFVVLVSILYLIHEQNERVKEAQIDLYETLYHIKMDVKDIISKIEEL